MKDTNTDNARKVTINIVKANIFAIVLMVASAVVLIVPYCLICLQCVHIMLMLLYHIN